MAAVYPFDYRLVLQQEDVNGPTQNFRNRHFQGQPSHLTFLRDINAVDEIGFSVGASSEYLS